MTSRVRGALSLLARRARGATAPCASGRPRAPSAAPADVLAVSGFPRGGPRHHPGGAAAREPFPRDGDSITWTRSASSAAAPPPPDDVDDEHRVIEIDLRGPPSTAVDVSDEVGQRFFGAPADYAGVAIRSTLNWPLPMDQVAKLNPKLALAMGASRAQVAGANRDRHTRLDPILPGERRDGRDGDRGLRLDDVDTSAMDDDELEILRMLRDDEARDRRRRATALDRARERREAEKEREEARRAAVAAGRRNAPYAPRKRGEEGLRARKAEYEAELARLEAERARLRLAEEWRAAKEEGRTSDVLPAPGSKPGVTPRVYNALKRQLLEKSDRRTMAKHTSGDLSPSAVGRLSKADLARACEIVGLPAGGDKKTMVEMLLAHFEEAESHFARAFVRDIAELDARVRRVKARARAAAEEEKKRERREEREAKAAAREATRRERLDEAAAAGERARAEGKGGSLDKFGSEKMRRADAAAKRARDIAIAERGWDDHQREDEHLHQEHDDDEEEEEDWDDNERDDDEVDLADAESAEDMSLDEPKGHARPAEGERMNYVEAFAPSELVDILLRARASDVVSIPVAEKCTWTEHFVVGTARSPRHIRMLAGAVLHAVKKRTKYVVGTQLRPSIEGADGPDGEEGDDHWMVVDCGSCVVHVFSAPARERYDLEGLWAPGVTLERRNPEDRVLTIDTIAPLDEEGEEGSGADGVGPDGTPEVDLEHMRSLEEYDDEYVEPPDWESSLTDLENRRAKRAGEKKGSRDAGGFGSRGVHLGED